MSERMTDGLKRAEQYFLEMARGSQEGEDYALAEVCNRAADRIAELEGQVIDEKDFWADLAFKVGEYEDIQIPHLKKRIAELEESLRLSIAGQSVEKQYSESLEGLLREHLNPPSEIDAFQWHDEYLNRCREALGDKV